jgi:hypothetical protein
MGYQKDGKITQVFIILFTIMQEIHGMAILETLEMLGKPK